MSTRGRSVHLALLEQAREDAESREVLEGNAADMAARPPGADEACTPAPDGPRDGEVKSDPVRPAIVGQPRFWSACELRTELSRLENELRERGRSAATVAMNSRRVNGFLAWVATR